MYNEQINLAKKFYELLTYLFLNDLEYFILQKQVYSKIEVFEIKLIAQNISDKVNCKSGMLV